MVFATVGTFSACGLAAYETITGKESKEEFQAKFDKTPSLIFEIPAGEENEKDK